MNHEQHTEHEHEHEHESASSEEMMYKASIIEKHMQELSEKADYISQQLSEMEEFNKNLGFMDNSSGKEMLASLGRGVYVKSSCKDKSLLVNVGSGILVKKTPQETKKIIEGQIRSFYEAKTNILSQLEVYKSLMNQTISAAQSPNKK